MAPVALISVTAVAWTQAPAPALVAPAAARLAPPLVAPAAARLAQPLMQLRNSVAPWYDQNPNNQQDTRSFGEALQGQGNVQPTAQPPYRNDQYRNDQGSQYTEPRPTLEILITTDGSRVGLHFDQADDGSVLISEVTEGSPAAAAGLRVDDRVVLIDGSIPDSADTAAALLESAPADVRVVVERSYLELTLMKPEATARVGVRFEEVAGGLTVEEVVDGLPASAAGLRRGDRVLQMMGIMPRSADEAAAILQAAAGDVPIVVERGPRAMSTGLARRGDGPRGRGNEMQRGGPMQRGGDYGPMQHAYGPGPVVGGVYGGHGDPFYDPYYHPYAPIYSGPYYGPYTYRGAHGYPYRY